MHLHSWHLMLQTCYKAFSHWQEAQYQWKGQCQLGWVSALEGCPRESVDSKHLSLFTDRVLMKLGVGLDQGRAEQGEDWACEGGYQQLLPPNPIPPPEQQRLTQATEIDPCFCTR